VFLPSEMAFFASHTYHIVNYLRGVGDGLLFVGGSVFGGIMARADYRDPY
jgi:hypothetical protein